MKTKKSKKIKNVKRVFCKKLFFFNFLKCGLLKNKGLFNFYKNKKQKNKKTKKYFF